MKRAARILGLLLLALPAAASAKDAYISMMYSNATEDALPFELIRSGSWHAAPGARYVKLHVYFDEPIEISAVEIDACSSPTSAHYSLWLNFDEWASSAQDEEIPYPRDFGVGGRMFYARGFDAGTEAHSLTWNFENWRGVSLCGLRVFDDAGAPYALRVPEVVPGTARASSTLEPAAAYDVRNLFDSRFEFGWASEGKPTDVDLVFAFDAPRNIDRLRIWNGYQRSPAHCSANSRAKRLQLSGDDGYAATVDVADVMGSQIVRLPSPFAGRELRIRVVDAWQGSTYRDLVISELRFGSGNGWFGLDPLPMFRSASNANRARFEESGLTGILNESFIARETSAVLRMRADGSFYLSGEGTPIAAGGGPAKVDAEEELEEAIRFFTLGNFEVLERDATKGLRVRLFGLYYETSAYGDCNGCGRDCNRAKDASRGSIFQEHVWIKPLTRAAGEAKFELVNESGGRKLPFRTLTFETQAAY